MCHTRLFLLLSLFWTAVVSQTCSQAKQIEGSAGHSDFITGVQIDSNGFVYASGWFQSNASFGVGNANTSEGNIEAGGIGPIHIAKYDSKLNYLWGLFYGEASSYVVSNDLGIDSANNLLFLGYTGTTSNISLGGDPLPAVNPDSDMLLAKYNSNGDHVWSKRIGGGSSYSYYQKVHMKILLLCIHNFIDTYERRAVNADPNDNSVVVVGVAEAPSDFGGGPITPVGYDIFLAKYAANGSYVFSLMLGGNYNEFVGDVGVDSSSNIVVVGQYESTDMTVGSLTVAAPAGVGDCIIMKFSPTGTPLWTQQFGGDSDDKLNAVAMDTSDNIWAGGYIRGAVTINGQTLSYNGDFDIILVKYSSSGNFLWAGAYGSSKHDEILDIKYGLDSALYFIGQYYADIYIQGWYIEFPATAKNGGMVSGKIADNGTLWWAQGDTDTIAVVPEKMALNDSVIAFAYESGDNSIAIGQPPVTSDIVIEIRMDGICPSPSPTPSTTPTPSVSASPSSSSSPVVDGDNGASSVGQGFMWVALLASGLLLF